MKDRYTKLAIQPFEYSHKNRLDPYQHTAIKYITRFRDKNGKEDIDKAIDTLEQLKKAEYPDPKGPMIAPAKMPFTETVGIQHLYQKILKSGNPYKLIITTGRGGMWLAANLGYMCNIKDVRCVTKKELPGFAGPSVLFVDSICDTGATLDRVNCDSAVLVNKQKGLPTFSAFDMVGDTYITFPIGQQYDV